MKKIIFSIVLVFLGLEAMALDLTDGLVLTTLENGLVVLIRPVEGVPLVNVQLGYHVGFQDSPSDQFEMPHFLEHMLFRQTEDFQDGEISLRISETGGYLNGYTSLDRTVYHCTVPSSKLEMVLDIEASRMDRALFPQSILETEIGIVSSEVRAGKANPASEFWSEVYSTMNTGIEKFMDHDRRIQEIEQFTPEMVEAFYRQYYRPDNAFLVIVGGVNPEEALALAEEHFGGIQTNGEKPSLVVPENARIEEAKEILGSGVIQQPFGARYFNFNPPDQNREDRATAQFIIATGLIPELEILEGRGFGFVVQNYNEIAPPPLEVLDLSILEENFPIAKQRLLYDQQEGYENVGAMARALVHDYSTLGDATIDDFFQREFEAMDFARVKDFLERYLDTQTSLTTHFAVERFTTEPAEASADISMDDDFGQNVDYSFLSGDDPDQQKYYLEELASSTQTLSHTMEEYLLSWQTFTLENGLEVYYQQYGISNQTRISVITRAGFAHESAPMVANYAGAMVLQGGPQIIDRNQFEQEGGSWSSSIHGSEHHFLNLSGRSELLPLMLEVAVKTFQDRELSSLILEARKESEMIARDSSRNTQDPYMWAWELVDQTVFPNEHPIQERLEADGIDRTFVSLEEVQAHYEQFYNPQNMKVVITSSLPFEEFQEQIQTSLGTLVNSPLALGVESQFTPKESAPGWVKKALPLQENVVMLVQPIEEAVSFEEVVALNLGYSILGQGMSSRLFREIRDRQGLGYAVSAWSTDLSINELFYHGGFLLVSQQNVDPSVEAFKTAVDDFSNNGPTELELLYAKNRLINQMAFEFQDSRSAHSTLASAVIYERTGLIDDYIQLILNIKREDIVEVFSNTLDPEDYTMIVVGNYAQ